MTPLQIRRVRHLLNELEQLEQPPQAHPLIREMRALVEPPPSIKDIFDLVPGDTLERKAQKVGITRSAYYKIVSGRVRPHDGTVLMLSKWSGVPVETIRAAQP